MDTNPDAVSEVWERNGVSVFLNSADGQVVLVGLGLMHELLTQLGYELVERW